MSGNLDSIVVYGTTWCPDCKRAKQFFGDQRIQYHWVDIEVDPESMAYVEDLNQGMRIVPTIVFPAPQGRTTTPEPPRTPPPA